MTHASAHVEKTATMIAFYDFHPQTASRSEEICASLSCKQKYLSPKYFYDEAGSQLFDQICELPEYYPTRTELALLQQHGPGVAHLIGTAATLFELGSGSSRKIRLLLEALRPSSYIPLDISRDHLIAASQNLARDYPWLNVHAACIDYSRSWQIPFSSHQGRRVAFFPGSSIGNFEPRDAVRLLREVGQLVGRDGGLLIGVDRVKPTHRLEAAYNDRQGVTAAFNLNALSHLNHLLDANFDIQNFSHHAFYNQQQTRIEMHLRAKIEHYVEIAGQSFHFVQGESIHTENSYKYTKAHFTNLAATADFRVVQHWSDDEDLFSLFYLQRD